MSITDVLRKWASVEVPYKHGHQLFAIADRIDAEHEKSVVDALLNDGLPMTDERMAEHGWVRLPKDADGEYIHIGDMMDGDHYEDGTVVGMQYFKEPNDSLRLLIAIKPHFWDTPTWHDPEEYRHHHAPTVEDVLREFTDVILEWAGKSGTVAEVGTWSDVAAEYAKRLRLVNDEE